MPLIVARTISAAEEDLIISGLRNVGDPFAAKVELQRLCEFLEHGSVPRRVHDLKPHVSFWLWRAEIVVRRWSYKAIALLGDASDFTQITARVKTEPDPENRAWGIAALAYISPNSDVETLCAQCELQFCDLYRLAAYTFERHHGTPLELSGLRINMETADPLTLKWLSLLEGYGRLPEGLVATAQTNIDVMAQLNRHEIPDVAEYSVWALAKTPLIGLSSLGLPSHEFRSRPAQVRRWFNRFITKSDEIIAENLDIVREASTDIEDRSREGLALGLAHRHSPEIETLVLQMFSRESEAAVRLPLLEHMARYAFRARLRKGCCWCAGHDSSLGCGPKRAVAGWPR